MVSLLFVPSLRVSSSEKADGGQWYSQFLLASMPYPGWVIFYISILTHKHTQAYHLYLHVHVREKFCTLIFAFFCGCSKILIIRFFDSTHENDKREADF